MKRSMGWYWLGLLALAAPCQAFAVEPSIAGLLEAGRLYANNLVIPEGEVVPGQRVRLQIEIGTDTWFTGGTRIRVPEIPGLVILQTEQFAANASETRDGKTWVIQRWSLDVFPQRAGDFTIEPIPVEVQVNAGSGDARGEIESPPVRFSVALPDTLASAGHWVAAPAFAVSQQFDRPLDGLAVGDAFEQEIRFEAADVLAMMLPAYEIDRQPGLAAYPAPPVLNNSTNRGQTRATRTVRVSYVVEQPGQYLLGARDYAWWNTQRGELELLTLPETRIEVTGAGAASPLSWKPDVRRTLLYLAGLLASAVVLGLAYRFLPGLPRDHVAALYAGVARQWRAFRAPALPRRLNPDAVDRDIPGHH